MQKVISIFSYEVMSIGSLMSQSRVLLQLLVDDLTKVMHEVPEDFENGLLQLRNQFSDAFAWYGEIPYRHLSWIDQQQFGLESIKRLQILLENTLQYLHKSLRHHALGPYEVQELIIETIEIFEAYTEKAEQYRYILADGAMDYIMATWLANIVKKQESIYTLYDQIEIGDMVSISVEKRYQQPINQTTESNISYQLNHTSSNLDWEREKAQIEKYPFRNDIRDVLHFTTKDQWAAWYKLSTCENSSDVDNYMRSLAPEGMVYISAGSFLMGFNMQEAKDALHEYKKNPADESVDNMKSHLRYIEECRGQARVNLCGYYIDRTPVTNRDYQKFVAADGYTMTGHWAPVGLWRVAQLQNLVYGPVKNQHKWVDEEMDYPVTGITWYEAMAYAHWAGKALPSEAHWEKAACWDPVAQCRYTYPWGNQFDSSRCHNQKETVDVGSYSPSGDSPYGVVDMVGNVAEWCTTCWGDGFFGSGEFVSPYHAHDGRENIHHPQKTHRIVKGGGLSFHQKLYSIALRSGFRTPMSPANLSREIGFRCIVPRVFPA